MKIEETYCVGGVSDKKWSDIQYHQQHRVYKGDVALALPASLPEGSYKYIVCGEQSMKKEIDEMKIKNKTIQGYIECPAGGCFDGQFPDSNDRRGRVQEGGNITPTLTAEGSQQIYYNEDEWRIRKLTPKECWRLMGYTDEDFEKAKGSGVSNSQLYKQAGNAIVKQVLMAIFSQMNIKGVKPWNENENYCKQ
jgi:DNA (cytosine-5)-methyltransferase 1